MRVAVTLGFPHGGGAPEMVASPAVELEKQKAAFKSAKGLGIHPKFERLELWLSDEGRAKHARLAKPPPVVKSDPPKQKT